MDINSIASTVPTDPNESSLGRQLYLVFDTGTRQYKLFDDQRQATSIVCQGNQSCNPYDPPSGNLIMADVQSGDTIYALEVLWDSPQPKWVFNDSLQGPWQKVLSHVKIVV
jgi:hypothetical protein